MCRLLSAIDATKTILRDLRSFNRDSWVVRYPQFRAAEPTAAPEDAESSKPRKRQSARRSLSFADDLTFQTDVVVNAPRKGITRSVTLSTIPDESAEEEEPTADEEDRLVTSSEAHDFHIFRLDLQLGSRGSSSSPTQLVSQLEKASIANLLDDRILSAETHIDKLRLRVEDTSSKVLVTGDLNAGKSTFVNAILRREVMPVDQQPCTTAFCEVHDAVENDGKEELHILKDGVAYDSSDDSTFTRARVEDLESFVSENENEQQKLKIYLSDARPQTESLLSNGVVDISLIDAPGLNRDSIKTTAVFARQEEIDVVVFVVSAENHFTLSAKEFLFTASNEKAYLFIVVNKYDQIRDKAKCRRLILDQIRQLSPRTYEDAEDLVHFVDSAAALRSGTTDSFESLEEALRSFVLVKRSKSKLAPASTYLTHILTDVDLLVGANAIVAQTELERAREDLERSRPVMEKLKKGLVEVEERMSTIEASGIIAATQRTKEILSNALDRVGSGKLGVDAAQLRLPSFPGFFNILSYAKDVRRVLLESLDLAVQVAEDKTRVATAEDVSRLNKLDENFTQDGVERSRRIFMPEVMFSASNRDKANRRKSRRLSTAIATGTAGLGLSLASRTELLDTTFFDIFDVQHQFLIHFGDHSKNPEIEESTLTALSLASVGVGALTMVGGKTLGIRGVVEGIVRVTDLFGNESARKWAAPVIGAVVIGTAAYYILELPSTIPKTIGRRIRSEVTKACGEKTNGTFVELHAERISMEVKKVLGYASRDVYARFNAALQDRSREVQGAEESEKKAKKAVEWFTAVHTRTGEVRENVELVESA